jgi:membrane protein DedA with SNARE-associated domain
LVLAGASVTTGHVNALVVMAATYLSAVLGAFAGREVFQGLGAAALPRISALLHAGKRADAITARLRRGGAAAVFLGRITPGLRVVTTEISGLVAMPRRTFVKGLLPAVAVYEALFFGLGAWLGPSALSTIEHYAPRPGELLLFLLIVFASALALHAVARRVRAFQLGRDEITFSAH